MNYIANKKYLKSNDVHFYAGWIMLASGIILFALGELFWIYIGPYQFVSSLLLMISGALTAFVPMVNRGNEEEFDEAIKKISDEMAEKNCEVLGKKLKNTGERAVVVGKYLLSGEELIVRRGRKDGKYRSSRYTAAAFSFTREGVYILARTVSLISNEDTERVFEIPYTSCPLAQVEEQRIKVLNDSFTQKELVVLENGVECLRIPVENSVFVDDLCQRIALETQRAKRC